jgi:predicted Zn-dependent protease
MFTVSQQSLFGARRLFSLWAPLLTAGLLVSCVTTGPGGQKSFLMFGSDYEVALGADANAQILEQEKLLEDSIWQGYVSEIGQRIVKVCDRTDIAYSFGVIDSDQVNAFALTGGYIYFYTGLLRLMESESQLAAVMAHEISHVVARHGMKRVQKALIAQMGYAVVFGNSESSEVRDAALGLSLGMLFSEYSRAAESEADEYGILYMKNAGYNPNGAVEMFEHLGKAGEKDPNMFEKLTSSHPETKDRINRAQAQIQGFGALPTSLADGAARYQQMKKRLPEKKG